MLRRLRGLSNAMLAADPMLAPAEVDTGRDELGELARAFAGLQQRLAQQEDARRMFVATASHELRTPLTLAADAARADRRRARPRSACEQDVAEALAAGQAPERAEQGPARPLAGWTRGSRCAREPMELGELSRAVAAEFGSERPTWIPPRHACWALGDPEGVARIVRLLVDNALRYAPAPAPVEVRTAAVNGHVEVRVLDGGAGIPDTERDAIFERFQRGENTTAPGFGLGLAIGAELARRMQGELKLEPGAPAGDEPGRRPVRARYCRMRDLPPGPREPSALQTVEWIVRPTALLRRAQARYGEPFTLRTAWTRRAAGAGLRPAGDQAHLRRPARRAAAAATARRSWSRSRARARC